MFVHAALQVFTNALYNLAANPQYVQPLREEVEATVENNGWSRSSLSKMHKVDSFLKETMRIEGVNTCRSLTFFYSAHHVVKSFLISFSSGLVAQGLEGLYFLRWDVHPERSEDPGRHDGFAS